MSKKNISGFLDNGTLYQFRGVKGSQGNNALQYYIRVISSTLKVNAFGKMTGSTTWQIIKNNGGEESITEQNGYMTCSVKLDTEETWNEITSYDFEEKIFSTGNLYYNEDYEELGSPTSLEIKFTMDDKVKAQYVIPIIAGGSGGGSIMRVENETLVITATE